MITLKPSKKEFKLQQLRKQLSYYAMALRAYPFNDKYRRSYNRIQNQIAKLAKS